MHRLMQRPRFLLLPSVLFERGESGDVSGRARSRIFATGDAGRRGDGGGARSAAVDSRCSLAVSLVEFGLVPEFGVMPMGTLPPARPSNAWWFPEGLLMVVVIGSLLLVGIKPESLEISSMTSLVCRNPRCLPSSTAATMVVVKPMKKGMKLVLATGSRAHHRRCLSFGAPGGQPVCSAAASSNSMAGGRPTFFLPALMLYGRQYCSSSVSTACCGGELGGPSGVVPGAGEFAAAREQFGPDCVPLQFYGVLSAYFRDCSVILSLFCVLQVVLYRNIQ